jgi:hypothetical protein
MGRSRRRAAAGNRGAARAIGRVLNQVEDLPPESREAITYAGACGVGGGAELCAATRAGLSFRQSYRRRSRAMLPADTIAEITTNIAALQLEPNTADIAVRPSASA